MKTSPVLIKGSARKGGSEQGHTCSKVDPRLFLSPYTFAVYIRVYPAYSNCTLPALLPFLHVMRKGGAAMGKSEKGDDGNFPTRTLFLSRHCFACSLISLCPSISGRLRRGLSKSKTCVLKYCKIYKMLPRRHNFLWSTLQFETDLFPIWAEVDKAY